MQYGPVASVRSELDGRNVASTARSSSSSNDRSQSWQWPAAGKIRQAPRRSRCRCGSSGRPAPSAAPISLDFTACRQTASVSRSSVCSSSASSNGRMRTTSASGALRTCATNLWPKSRRSGDSMSSSVRAVRLSDSSSTSERPVRKAGGLAFLHVGLDLPQLALDAVREAHQLPLGDGPEQRPARLDREPKCARWCHRWPKARARTRWSSSARRRGAFRGGCGSVRSRSTRTGCSSYSRAKPADTVRTR